MATWVEDIFQALKDLGGKGSLSEIYDQVERVRKEPMPPTWKASIRERIEAYSRDSTNFKGKHYFSKIDKGIWALSDFVSPTVPKQDKEEEKKELTMDTDSNITDNGLFVGKELLKFSVEDSLESISNIFQTIKQYRDYADKENIATWFQYIHDIFNILGLNTIKISPRLFKLQDLGVDHEPKALVCIVGPNENYENLAYEVTWDSYLFYAAKFHRLDWVILTNGLQFKVMNYSNDQDKNKFFKMAFDEVVEKGNINSFFTFYKLLNVINQFPKKSSPSVAGKSNPPREGGKHVLSDLDSLRIEFWTQFLERAKVKTNLFANRNPRKSNVMALSSGKRGVGYYPTANSSNTRVEIYIDNGNYEWNKAIFDYLYQHKSDIETSLAAELVWMRLEEYRASAIRLPIEGKTLRDKEAWTVIQDSLIDSTIKLEAVFRPLIQNYPV